ncbi:unnamed protein product, partial [Phaeothamnion confervicola]
ADGDAAPLEIFPISTLEDADIFGRHRLAWDKAVRETLVKIKTTRKGVISLEDGTRRWGSSSRRCAAAAAVARHRRVSREVAAQRPVGQGGTHLSRQQRPRRSSRRCTYFADDGVQDVVMIGFRRLAWVRWIRSKRRY